MQEASCGQIGIPVAMREDSHMAMSKSLDLSSINNFVLCWASSGDALAHVQAAARRDTLDHSQGRARAAFRQVRRVAGVRVRGQF